MYYELRDMPLSSPHRYIRFVLGEQRRDDLDRVYFINHQMNDIIGRWSVAPSSTTTNRVAAVAVEDEWILYLIHKTHNIVETHTRKCIYDIYCVTYA